MENIRAKTIKSNIQKFWYDWENRHFKLEHEYEICS